MSRDLDMAPAYFGAGDLGHRPRTIVSMFTIVVLLTYRCCAWLAGRTRRIHFDAPQVADLSRADAAGHRKR
ncbi:hypothetical protein BDI4_340045 [Burkholderia diffusa]|uniref:hypothetical protein n=1 Tax=Burkholderia diffusa TaxID=488732 RepID=UPI001CAE2424|nr:hypothetical protein [Burkholderia diffusa]CAG9252404.1 hypothetical protein BDI4_340045 [Burkholderia diffusa]